METPNYKMLPNQLNLEMVATEMALVNMSPRSKIEVILYHQRNGRIALKADVATNYNVHETAAGLDENYDSNGNVIVLSGGKDFWIETSGRPITLGPAHLIGDALIVSTFTFEDKEYYPLDEPGMHPLSLSFSINDVYVDKVDLEDFLERGPGDIPAYADPASEHFAPELALAVTIHKALRMEGKINPRLNMVDRVDLWLRQNTPNKKPPEIRTKRLATIIGDGKKIESDLKNIKKTKG
ncbi:hypothetical protein Q6D67_04720 [Haliea sp. E1-2-M8]|uniref:hypothetical protein n=1 Tax=Haliea sp. E1-2-M8 TaxID=3064706 RepID=UPI0027183984|nr:hypothetical protein [Haliea sp. E1-2-M8]MDO8860998.1 hypothetical protein [Haliea sp. E1-2-M8]